MAPATPVDQFPAALRIISKCSSKQEVMFFAMLSFFLPWRSIVPDAATRAARTEVPPRSSLIKTN